MSAGRREELRALVLSLLEEAEKEPEGEIGDQTSLIQSGLLDSLELLQIAEWVSDRLGAPLDLSTVDVREEWDTIAGMADFLEARGARS